MCKVRFTWLIYSDEESKCNDAAAQMANILTVLLTHTLPIVQSEEKKSMKKHLIFLIEPSLRAHKCQYKII